jgi:hypothetical protein
MLMGDSGAKLQTSDRPDDGMDNLTSPIRGEQPAKGEWATMDVGRSSYTRVFEHHPMAKAVALGAAAALGAGLLRWVAGGRRSRVDRPLTSLPAS